MRYGSPYKYVDTREREVKPFLAKTGKNCHNFVLYNKEFYLLKAKPGLFLSSQDSELACYEISMSWKTFLRNAVVHRKHFSLLAVPSTSPISSTEYRNMAHDDETGLPLTQHFLPGFYTQISTKSTMSFLHQPHLLSKSVAEWYIPSVGMEFHKGIHPQLAGSSQQQV